MVIRDLEERCTTRSSEIITATTIPISTSKTIMSAKVSSYQFSVSVEARNSYIFRTVNAISIQARILNIQELDLNLPHKTYDIPPVVHQSMWRLFQ